MNTISAVFTKTSRQYAGTLTALVPGITFTINASGVKMFERKELTGAAFPNKYKMEGDNKPDFVGDALVRGETLRLAVWNSKDRNGNHYFNIKFSEPIQNRDEMPQAGDPDAGLRSEDITPPDDDLPF